MHIETNDFLNQPAATTHNILFTQTVKALEQLSYYSCPQHMLLSEEEFLKNIGIVNNEVVKVRTSLEAIDFSSTGEYPLLITILNTVTKERSVKVLRLIIFPSKQTYAVLKNSYWRPYGFVLEGIISHTHLNFFNEEAVNTMEVVPIAFLDDNNSQLIESKIKLSQHKWFHVVLENEILEQLDTGEYRFQIKSFETKNKISHLSKIIDKKNQGLFSSRVIEPLTNEIEVRIFKKKIVQIFTTNTGEVHMRVRHMSPQLKKK